MSFLHRIEYIVPHWFSYCFNSKVYSAVLDCFQESGTKLYPSISIYIICKLNLSSASLWSSSSPSSFSTSSSSERQNHGADHADNASSFSSTVEVWFLWTHPWGNTSSVESLLTIIENYKVKSVIGHARRKSVECATLSKCNKDSRHVLLISPFIYLLQSPLHKINFALLFYHSDSKSFRSKSNRTLSLILSDYLPSRTHFFLP